MIIFKKFQQVKAMITQMVVCWTIIISKNYCKVIAIDLSKQQTLDADPKPIQQITFSGNLEQQATIFFINKEAKETVLDFPL